MEIVTCVLFNLEYGSRRRGRRARDEEEDEEVKKIAYPLQ